MVVLMVLEEFTWLLYGYAPYNLHILVSDHLIFMHQLTDDIVSKTNG